MSKNQTEREAKKEIENLNQTIDWKIIKGLSYRKEATRHKFLLSHLSELKPNRQIAWSWKSSFAGMF